MTIVLALVWIVVLPAGAPVLEGRPAQPSETSRAAVDIAPGAALAFPGGEFTVAIEMTFPANDAAGMIAFTLFVPDGTQFRSVERSYALEQAGGQAAARRDPRQTTRAIAVTIRSGRAPLPEGVVAYLVLAADPDAPLGDRELRGGRGTAIGMAGEALAPVVVRPAKISVVDPASAPLTACFFYMH